MESAHRICGASLYGQPDAACHHSFQEPSDKRGGYSDFSSHARDFRPDLSLSGKPLVHEFPARADDGFLEFLYRQRAVPILRKELLLHELLHRRIAVSVRGTSVGGDGCAARAKKEGNGRLGAAGEGNSK